MKFGKILIAGLIVTVAAVGIAQDGQAKAKPMMGKKIAMAPAMSKAEWQKGYDQAAKMFDKEDVEGVFKHMAPGFTMTMMGQTMDAKASKAGLKQWFNEVSNMKCKMTVTKVTQKGNTAVVVDTFHNTGMMMNPKTKKMGKFVDSGTETITWVMMSGKWMMKKLVMNTSKMTLDGKPFNPGM